MASNAKYALWLQKAVEDSDLIEELKRISGDEKEIYDRFYKELEFGTAGLRGVIGAGTNRMNIYTVRRTTQGLANYLNSKKEGASVAIAYDSRIKSELFARECARVLAANGITARIVKELQPVPVLSFAVRELRCDAGIMITASHNPAKYNGYKCYGPDGCQMTDTDADNVYAEILKVDLFDGVEEISFDQGLETGKIVYIEDSFYDKYLDCLEAQSVNPGVCAGSGLKIVYTPLNGAGNKLVRKILARIGVKEIQVVPEQELPDGSFPTCPYPNPEFREALTLALKLAQESKPDLVLATDPDSDRVGIAVKDGDDYRLMTGNETGIMLMNYILSCRKRNGTLPERPVAVKTIVTSEMIPRICADYGCELRNVLTGFKYIGEQILGLERAGEADRFVFGFEESYGYLAGTHARDKDAVVASMLICEMAAYYKLQGLSLGDVMDKIYADYGYYDNAVVSYTFEGEAGMEKMAGIMNHLRQNPPKSLGGSPVVEHSDYQSSLSTDLVSGKSAPIDLPKSNVLEYKAENGCKLIVRPSGTEPKIKTYVTAVAADKAVAQEMGQQLIDESAAWMA